MNDQDYQLLIDLYETQNITKTAQLHFMTQPALTKRIHRIEEELGGELLLRSKKGILFTAVGETVVKHCHQIVQANERLRDAINQSKGVVGGTLRIGSSLNYGRYRLPRALRMYQQMYPKVDINITTGKSQVLYQMLEEHKLSVAIVRGDHSWTEGSLLLSAEPICLVRSYENLDKPLTDYTYIGHHTDPYEEQRIEQWLEENGVLRTSRIWIDDIASCRELAQAGVGWTIIPSICLEGFQGEVTPLRTKDGTMLLRNTYIYYRDSQYELQQVRRFLEVLAQNDATYPEIPQTLLP